MSVSMTSSIKFNHDLIDAYQKCTVLYDCDHPDYKAPAPTNESWAYVAEQCGTTPQDCRARWKALRDRYIKERKRRTLGKCDPAKKYWPLYGRMDFLDEYVEKQRRKYPKNGLTKENQIRLAGGELDLQKFQDVKGLEGFGGISPADASLYSILTPDFLNGNASSLDEAASDRSDSEMFSNPNYEKLIKAMEESNANGASIFPTSSANGDCQSRESNENVSNKSKAKENEIAISVPASNFENHFTNSTCDFNLSAFVASVAATSTATATDMMNAVKTELSPLSINTPSTMDSDSYATDYLKTYGKRVLGKTLRKSSKTRYSPTKNGVLQNVICLSRKRPAHSISAEISPHEASDTLEALRVAAENLTRYTQALMERDAEASFGDYVASVLRVMSLEKRNEMRAKIFAMLNFH